MRCPVSTRVPAIVLSVLCLVGSVAVALGQESPPARGVRAPVPTITVVGSGSVSAPPDSAEIMAGVVTRGATAAQALKDNNASMDKVLKAVAAQGVAPKDVQTIGVSVTPQRRQGKPDAQPLDIIGYEVSNQIRVHVRDLAILGRLLDVLVGEGANALGGVGFSVASPQPFLDQARQRAVADARRKAELYATAAGVTLGRVLSIQDYSAAVPRFAEARVLTSAPSVPIAAGEQEFQVSVTISYAIQ